MAFFRFNRDKRGYEYFYLVEPVTNRRGKTRSRVLYWYRTPPKVRVGRAPFDEEVQRALEAQNPTVSFDWPKILEAPIPSAEAEKWRERRRAERAEKAERATRQQQAAARAGEETAAQSVDVDAPRVVAPPEGPQRDESAPLGTPEHPYRVGSDQIRKRRRRRRGRGARRDAAASSEGAAPAEPSNDAPAASDDGEKPADPPSKAPGE